MAVGTFAFEKAYPKGVIKSVSKEQEGGKTVCGVESVEGLMMTHDII